MIRNTVRNYLRKKYITCYTATSRNPNRRKAKIRKPMTHHRITRHREHQKASKATMPDRMTPARKATTDRKATSRAKGKGKATLAMGKARELVKGKARARETAQACHRTA